MADLTIKRGDTSPPITATIVDGTGATVNLTGATVTFVMRQLTAYSPAVNAAATIVNAVAGTVSYTFTAADTAVAGKYMAEWHVTTSGATKLTYPTDGWLEVVVEEDLITGMTPRLVSVAEVRDHLRLQVGDHTHDQRLEEMIDAAAPIIEGICGPVLQRKVQDETYDGGSWFIQLRNKPVLEVQQVVEYRGPIPYNLTQVPTPDLGQIYSYMFEPPGRIVRRTVGGGITPFPPGADQVIVTYIAGYQTVPSNIREATLEAIRENFQQTEMASHPAFGNTGSGRDDMEPSGPASEFYLTPRLREMLAPSKRPPSVA